MVRVWELRWQFLFLSTITDFAATVTAVLERGTFPGERVVRRWPASPPGSVFNMSWSPNANPKCRFWYCAFGAPPRSGAWNLAVGDSPRMTQATIACSHGVATEYRAGSMSPLRGFADFSRFFRGVAPTTKRRCPSGGSEGATPKNESDQISGIASLTLRVVVGLPRANLPLRRYLSTDARA